MKIIYVVHQFYPEYYTGTEKFVVNLAKMAQRAGHKVKVVTYGFYDKSSCDRTKGNIFTKEFMWQGIPVFAFCYEQKPEDLHISMYNSDLTPLAERILEEEKPDLIHVGHPMRMTELLHVAKKKRIPYIITLTDFWFICPKYILFTSKNNLCQGPAWGDTCKKECPEFNEHVIQSRLKIALELMKGAYGVFSPSHFLADIFNRELDEISVEVIPHGINYKNIIKNETSYSKKSHVTFFFAGSFSEFKGLHLVLKAFNQIRSDRIALKIYGSGICEDYNDRLQKLAHGDGRIEFCGVFSDDQLGAILNTVDVAILPSLWFENYPLVLHEALASDVPVIASDIGGMAEKITDDYNGFTFKVGNVESLKEVIEKIIDNPERLNGIKKNIRNFMIPTIEQEAYLYEKIYNFIVSVNG